jgi:hypothetical protein
VFSVHSTLCGSGSADRQTLETQLTACDFSQRRGKFTKDEECSRLDAMSSAVYLYIPGWLRNSVLHFMFRTFYTLIKVLFSENN